MQFKIQAYGLFSSFRFLDSLLIQPQYSVTIAAEMNYAIMAALTTVLDDLRTDEGC